jgi:hypothetical protein
VPPTRALPRRFSRDSSSPAHPGPRSLGARAADTSAPADGRTPRHGAIFVVGRRRGGCASPRAA